MDSIVFLDFETTGVSEQQDYIIEIGAIKLDSDFRELARMHYLVKPPISVPRFITVLTNGLSDTLLKDAPSIEELRGPFLDFVGNSLIIAHNAEFETKFIKQHIDNDFSNKIIDSIEIFALFFPNLGSLSLDTILRETKLLEDGEKHRALEDAYDLYRVFLHIIERRFEPEMQNLLSYLNSKMQRFNWDWKWFIDFLIHNLEIKDTNAKLDRESKILSSVSLFSDRRIDIEKLYKALDKLPETRIGQKDYLRAVVSSIENSENLVIEAGTGIGKTVAYLLPTFFYANNGGRVLISTRTKNLQEQILKKDLPLARSILKEANDIVVAKIQGRENYLCKRLLDKYLETSDLFADFDEAYLSSYLFALANISETADLNLVPYYLKRKYGKLSAILNTIKSNTRTCLGKNCPYYNNCHYFTMLKKAKKAQVLIANHALVFNWPNLLKKPELAIFDEAHNLLDSSISAKTESFSSLYLDYLTKQLEKYDIKLVELLQRYSRDFFEELALKMDGNIDYPIEKLLEPKIDGLVVSIEKLKLIHETLRDKVIPLLKTHNDTGDIIEKFKEVIEFLENFLLCQNLETDYAFWFYLEHKKREWRLNFAPSTPYKLLKETYNDFETIVLTSATMPSIRYLGFTEIAHKSLSIESPFDYKKNIRVIFMKNSLAPWHKDFVKEFSNTIKLFAKHLNGRVMALFSSLKRLDLSMNILLSELENDNFFVLKGCKSGVLNFFKNHPKSLILGSESCAEGIDIKGDSLVGILIERMPIVLKGPITRVRMLNEDDWSEYELEKRIIKLKQWIGRLIRTKQDKGLVVIFDDWFAKQSDSVKHLIARKLAPMPVAIGDYLAINDVFYKTVDELDIFM